MTTFRGFNPPFYRPGNVMPAQTDLRLIKNDLLQLLLTSPGERVMRPDFGSPIPRFVFEPGDENALNRLRSGIIQSIAKWEPRVSVRDVVINTDQIDDNQITIIILAGLILDRPQQATSGPGDPGRNIVKEFELQIGVHPGVDGGPPANRIVV